MLKVVIRIVEGLGISCALLIGRNPPLDISPVGMRAVTVDRIVSLVSYGGQSSKLINSRYTYVRVETRF